MTAEVLIMNRSAIAIAADSAATVGDRVYNTENKIFTLSKYNPVGIMIYQNSSFMGVPWATIIKDYRSYLGEKSFSTIKEYSKDFSNYLVDTLNFSKIDKALFFFELIISGLEKLKTYIEEVNPKDNNELSQYLASWISHAKKAKPIGNFNSDDVSKVFDQYMSLYEDAFKAVFEDFEFDKTAKSKILSLIKLIVIRSNFSSFYTGVVIAGFGDIQLFPSCIDLKFIGILNDKLLFESGQEEKIDNSNRGFIGAYAQSDVVVLFLEGIDSANVEPFLNVAINNLLKDFSNKIISEIKNQHGKKKIQTLSESIIEESISKFDESFKRFRQKYNSSKIVNTVSVLPKEDLANMAEALVNLASLKKRVSAEKETVGGLADVALISKGDGFVWINRKHYFSLDLNPHFVRNYYREPNKP
ncbi:MAG: hypothetical protein KC553_09760 [Nitrospina sp.]|nr:hypothetical protein [Nitrospina sp.]